MTSPHSADYPPSKNWDEFEQLCRALLSVVYGGKFKRWGRPGQCQNGVDAYLLKKDGYAIAIQCKVRSKGPANYLTPKELNDAVDDIASFPHPISEFIVLTTGPNDTVLDDEATALTLLREAKGESSVSVWGWGTICDYIGMNESIQKAFFGHWFQKLTNRIWIVRFVAATLIFSVCVVVIHRYIESNRLSEERISKSILDLQQFVQLTDELTVKYSKCQSILDANIFTFSADFKRSCSEPVSVQLHDIDKQLEKVGALIDADAWSEISSLSTLMLEDYRQGSVAADMTNFFEEQVIINFKELCFKSATRTQTGIVSSRGAGHDAMVEQLHFYFVLRDFILPGLRSMKARILVRARMVANEKIPDGLLEQANALPAILSERKAYKYLNPQEPFTLSAVKEMSSRSIQMHVDVVNNEVENARWSEVYSGALFKVFQGKPKEVEVLIQCGVFKPEALKLSEKL